MTPRFDPYDEKYDADRARAGHSWGLIAAGAAALLAILVMAASRGPADCERIADSGARLACYDAASSPQPAKGAAVPGR